MISEIPHKASWDEESVEFFGGPADGGLVPLHDGLPEDCLLRFSEGYHDSPYPATILLYGYRLDRVWRRYIFVSTCPIGDGGAPCKCNSGEAVIYCTCPKGCGFPKPVDDAEEDRDSWGDS